MDPHKLVGKLIERDGGTYAVARAMKSPNFQGTLHKIANGKVTSPARQSAEKIARHFGIPIEALYDEKAADAAAERLELCDPDVSPTSNRGTSLLALDEATILEITAVAQGIAEQAQRMYGAAGSAASSFKVKGTPSKALEVAMNSAGKDWDWLEGLAWSALGLPRPQAARAPTEVASQLDALRQKLDAIGRRFSTGIGDNATSGQPTPSLVGQGKPSEDAAEEKHDHSTPNQQGEPNWITSSTATERKRSETRSVARTTGRGVTPAKKTKGPKKTTKSGKAKTDEGQKS